MKTIFFLLLIVPFFLLPLVGCGKKEVFSAFKGTYAASKNNKIIHDYCTGCHQHNSFFPNGHVHQVAQLYKEKKFQSTNECRICHYLKKSFFFGDIVEKTIAPEDAHKYLTDTPQ